MSTTDATETVVPTRKKRPVLKTVLVALAVLVVAFVVVVALQPSGFSVTRSASVAAPPAVVFEQVNDFHKWEAWSPWAKRDPAMKQSIDGPPAGAGAVYSWSGNKEVGEGRMTVTESRAPELVRIRLEFIKPFAGTSDTEFTFRPDGGGQGTDVTWTMSGKNNFVGKAMCLFMDMDKMVGGDFEKGLAQMKAVAEAAARK